MRSDSRERRSAEPSRSGRVDAAHCIHRYRRKARDRVDSRDSQISSAGMASRRVHRGKKHCIHARPPVQSPQ